ncbi:hypothetical protein TNCV_374741 [Trichonephila clavipes]|nr:hypothetical protein TNCV_374741 [Trichonephila clavipes]
MDLVAFISMEGCGSPVVKVSDHDRHIMGLSPVSLKTRRVGHQCMLNRSRAETSIRWNIYHEIEHRIAETPPCRGAMHVLSVEAQTSSHWCVVEVRRWGASSGFALIT